MGWPYSICANQLVNRLWEWVKVGTDDWVGVAGDGEGVYWLVLEGLTDHTDRGHP